jgi:predicted solute-binding protein
LSSGSISLEDKLRVCAVSYLNTVPLVWGMMHGPQQGIFDLSFSVPAECADRLARGTADIGLVPCAELDRLGLEFIPSVGIACRGPVRSILLISKVEPGSIRTLAADSSSRTSVMLTRAILADGYGCRPTILSLPPDLQAMLERADAALIIGDPALALDPPTLPYHVLDLGGEWVSLTGLPMVFAVWAGRPAVITPEVGDVFLDSYRFGASRLNEMLGDAARRGIPEDLARSYLTQHISFELGPAELRGLELFRRRVAEFREAEVMTPASS